jgi:hypothetical protein
MNFQSNLIIRSQKRENINAILIRRCKELNQSLHLWIIYINIYFP